MKRFEGRGDAGIYLFRPEKSFSRNGERRKAASSKFSERKKGGALPSYQELEGGGNELCNFKGKEGKETN